MNLHRKNFLSEVHGFIDAKLLIVLAAVIAGVCVLAYEWTEARPKGHHSGSMPHQHHHKHEEKSASTQ